jgi:pilus assembly protein CpaC
MHRKNLVPRRVRWPLLLGLLLGGAVLAGPVAAQDAPAPTVIVPINATKTLQMKDKQRIKTVQNQDGNIARVSPIQNDPTSVLVTGLMAGTTHVTLTDMQNRTEPYDIVVQLDVAFLRKVLQDTLPTANVIPYPVGSGAIILAGTVSKVEDLPIVMSVAQSVSGGIQLTNALTVGGVQQVQLCVSVARVSRSQMRQMSFEFLRAGPNNVFASTLGNQLSFTSTSGPINALGAVSSATGLPGNLFYGIMTPNHAWFGWLEALRDEGLTKILAEPKVVTISGRPASFLDGGEQAIPVPAGLGQIGVQFEEFGTRLNVLPIVLGNGKIHLEIEPEVSTLDAAAGTSIGGTVVPGRDTQRVHTSVELETGQTFAIGGLVQRRVTGTATKVPILGDVPVVGTLFRGVQFTQQEDELLILVTPYLVDALACNQLPKYRPGEETRIPDDFELFLEGILEAPRGPRELWPNGHYQAAWKNGPNANEFPCGGDNCGSRGFSDCLSNGYCGYCGPTGAPGNGNCGANGTCGKGNGGTNGNGGMNGHGAPGGPVQPAPMPPATVPVQTPPIVPTGGTLQTPDQVLSSSPTPAGQTTMRPAFETAPVAPTVPTDLPPVPDTNQSVNDVGSPAPPAPQTARPADQPPPAANFGVVEGH